MEPADSPAITIVIPVYDEEAILRASVLDLIDRLEPQQWSYELVLAENGSSDRTPEIVAELAARFPQVLTRHTDEPNYGRALRDAILNARGRIVICDEIDLCDVEFHQRAVEELEDPSIDFVIGSKAMAGAQDERPLYRRLGTRIINGMLRVTLGFDGTDTHGLKAFRRQRVAPIANACVVDRDLFASELVIRAQREGLRIREIPVRVLEKRPPSVGLARRVPHVMRNLAKLVVAIRVKR